MNDPSGRQRRSFRLRTYLIGAGLLVLAMPIAGLAATRILETVLHRQTESKLAAEAAYVGSLYVDAVLRMEGAGGGGLPAFSPSMTFDADAAAIRAPSLDLGRETVLPPAGNGKVPSRKPDPVSIEAGLMVQPILKAAQPLNLSATRILDDRGVVVATTGSETGLDLSGRSEVAEALAGRYKAVLREREREAHPGPLSRFSRYRVFVAQPIVHEGRILGVAYISRTSLSLFRDLWETRYTWMLAGMFLMTLAVTTLLSYAISRSIRETAARAESIACGRGGEPPQLSRWAPREVVELNDSLDVMVATLESRLKYVEEFSRGISHELKAPITAIKGSVEILRDNWPAMTSEERERFIGIIRSDIERTERLVRRILELARLESSHPPEGSCDLIDVLRPLLKRAGASGRTVSLVAGTKVSTARIPHEMAELLLGNLLENAFVHGEPSFEVEISDGPVVVIRDHGKGIPPEHMNRIFERFFTTARSQGGTGLGLSLAKAVAGRYGISLRADSRPGLTEFTVGFAGGGRADLKTRPKSGQAAISCN